MVWSSSGFTGVLEDVVVVAVYSNLRSTRSNRESWLSRRVWNVGSLWMDHLDWSGVEIMGW